MTYYNEPYYNEVDPSNHGPNTPRYNRAVTVYMKPKKNSKSKFTSLEADSHGSREASGENKGGDT